MDDNDFAFRDVELGEGFDLKIKEFSLLQDEAGAVVWDAALVLSYYLAHQQAKGRSLVAGRSCLELGSGTGCVGLAAGRLGAAQVYLSDLPHLVPYLRENIQLNGLGATCSALALEWANDAHLAQARATVLLRPPDVVLASDVVYTPATREGLFATLAAVMAPAPSSGSGPSGDSGDGGGSGSVAILSFELRPGVEELPGLCDKYGLLVSEVPRHELHPSWTSDDIRVLLLLKRPSAQAA